MSLWQHQARFHLSWPSECLPGSCCKHHGCASTEPAAGHQYRANKCAPPRTHPLCPGRPRSFFWASRSNCAADGVLEKPLSSPSVCSMPEVLGSPKRDACALLKSATCCSSAATCEVTSHQGSWLASPHCASFMPWGCSRTPNYLNTPC